MKTFLQTFDFIKIKAILVAILIISASTSFTQVILDEGFESGIVPPSGWSESGSGDWVQNTWGNPHTGVGWAYCNGAGSYLISPPINVTNSMDVSYWYKAESFNWPQDMDIMISTDPSSFVDIVQQVSGATNTSYVKSSFSLAAYVGQTVYIAFVGQTGSGGYDYGICLDDVMVYGLPPCAGINAPANTASNISINTNLTWTAAPLATGYKVYFGTDFPPTNISNGTDVGPGLNYSPPFTLDYSTLYYWSIIAYNNNGDAIGCSTWSFTTEGDPTIVNFPWTEEFFIWPPSGWDPTGSGTESWESYNANSASCDFWSWAPGSFAELITPPIDLTQETLEFNLTFRWSHLYMAPWPNDQLEVQVTEIGSGSWTTIWLETGPGLNSNDGATAHMPGTYVEAAMQIPAAFQGKLIQFKFIGTSGGGPELFIDNVTVSAIMVDVTGDEACEGFSGTLTANPFAGIPPFSYLWSEGSTTQSITVSPTTTTVYTVTVTDATTNSATAEGTMLIHPTPVVTINNLDPQYCINAPIVTMIGNQAPDGSFVCTTAPYALIDNGDGTATFDPAVAFLGTHQITYTYVDPYGCTNFDARSVEVLTLPAVSFSGLSGPYCASTAASDLLTGNPLNGTFTGPGIIDHGDGTGTFDPELAGPGVNHSITYTYVDPVTGCSNYDQQYVTVLETPTVDAGPDEVICEGASIKLNGMASGGLPPYTFLWEPAASLNDPTASSPIATPPATTTYTLTVTDANGCSNSDDVMVTVNVPVATVSDDEICIGESATLGVNPSGGSDPYTYNWTPIDYLDDPTAQYPVATPPAPGDYIYQVVITDAIGCTGTGTLTLTVHPLPVVDFSGLNSPYCANDAPALLTGNYAPEGTFTGTAITDHGDGTATFDPVAAGPGNYEITYTYTDGNGCTNSEIKPVIVNVVPIVSFSGLDPEYCVDWSAATLTGNHAPDGNFTGAGITDNGDGTATFLPAAAGVGTFDITYTYTNIFGCTDFEVQSVIVHPLPVVTFDPLADVCINTPTFALTGGMPLGGTYSGAGVTAGDFTASIAGLGTHNLTYTYTDINGCTDYAYQTITVHDTTMIYIVNPLSDVCVDDPSFILAIGFPPGGIYYGPGVSLSGSDYIFDPAVAGVGTHTLYYAYTNSFNCTSTIPTTIVVNPLPVVSFTGLNAEYCVDDAPSTLTGDPAGGYFTGPGTALNMFYPDVAGPGTHNITYTYTDPNGCTDFQIQTTIVHDLPVVTLDPLADVCVDVPAFALSGGNPAGGVYSGTGVSGGDFDPAAAGVGTHIITYTYTDPTTTCVNFATQPITVNPLPPANAGADVSICYGNCTNLTASGGTLYNWSTGETTPQINVCPTSTTTYIVTVTDNNGCSDTDDVIVNVWPLPVPDAGPDVSICLNDCTTLIATGGVSYIWSNNVAKDTIEVCPQTTTTYTVTVTDANGCSDTDDVTITVWPLPTANAGPDVSICLNDCTDLTANGGATYAWSNGSTDAMINVCPTTTTTYFVTVTDLNGCTDADDVTVTVWPLPTAYAFPNSEVCLGECTILNATGGVTYLWNTGSNQEQLLACPTSSTTYTVTVTDINGCTDSDEVIVIVNPLPTANAGPDVEICYGDCTILNASGGSIFEWSNSIFGPTQSVCPTSTTTYTVTVTDINGCTDVDEVTVTVNPLPPADAGTDVEICFGDCASLTASGGVSYVWSNGASTATIDVCPNITTTYIVTVTDANGCSDTDDVIVTVNPFPVANAGMDVEICNGDCTNLTASGAGAGGAYSWNNGSTTASINVCPTMTTTYTVTVTDNNGCTDDDEVIVTVNPLPPADAGPDVDICFGECTTLTATGGVAYLWSNNIANQTTNVCPTTTTTYTVTVTDANGCSQTDDVTVTVNPLPPADAGTDVEICFGECTSLTATGGVAYVWNNGASTATIDVCPNITTTYTVTVTDANGCSDTDDVMVTVHVLPIAYAFPSTDICFGECITVNATGAGVGGTYLWDDGSVTATINVCPTATTTYSVTVTDINGCTDSDEAIITVNPLPPANAGPDVAICFGECTTLTATGGVAYLWSNNIANQTTDVCPTVTTTYTVTVTDANGCSDTDDVTVTVNPLPPADAGPDVDICYGDCAALTASGGVAYIWSTGNTAATINVCPLVTTVYVVTVTDANGCSDTDDVIVTVNPLPVANAGMDVEICNGDCTNLTASGAGAGGAYSWNNGSTTASINVCPTMTTTYTVTVTDINGCSDDDEVIVTVNPLPPADAGPDVDICFGECTTLTATGGVAYLWSNNIANQTTNVCPTTTTTYTVTVTDANGCSDTDDVTVTVNPLPPADAGTDVEICFGDCTTLTATGGVSYVWNNGASTATVDVCPNITTTYTVTVTDANGCSDTDDVMVTVHELPTAYAFPSTDICFGECITVNATGAGVGGTYLWDDGSVTATINVCPTATTTYSVTVTDINGCTDSDEAIITVNPLPPASAGPDVAICFGECTTLTATGGVTYLWSNNIANQITTVCPTVTTTYTVTVTDANGCSDTDDVTVTVNPLPPADAGPDVDICYGDCATLTASGGVAYIWSTGNTAATINVCPLVTTVYVVTVTDANGCSDTDDVIVTVNPLPVANAGMDVEICNGDCTNLTASGAGAGGAYSWNNGSTTASINVCPTITTTYTVTVTDINGCTDDDEVIVTVNPLPPADAGPDVDICFGECTTLTATGGVAYLWSNNIANQTTTVCPTVTTTYTVTVTDANGCSDTDDVTVTVNPLPPADAGPDMDICYGDCATLTASGGVAYIWSTGNTAATINVCPLVTTVYVVTVTDANGCSDTDDVIVTVNPLPVANAGMDVEICNGDCTNLTASGAGAGGAYSWNNGSTTASINVCPTITTTYTVTVTDINGCTDDDEVIVTVNPLPPADAGPDVDICFGECTTLTATGGVTYLWSNNIANQTTTVCPTVTTTYTVTVTDANGCSDTDDVTVTVNPLPPADAGPDVDICYGDCATLTASGGVAYIWSTGNTAATINVCPLVTTVYVVTVTDANGCSDTDDVIVTVNPLPVANAGPDVEICYGDCTNLTASGAGAGGAYSWNNGSTTASINVCPTITTTYTVTVTDINGCTDDDEVIVTVNPLPPADAGPDVAICFGECTTLTATGGVAYLWSNNIANQTTTVCPTVTTTYTVTVTDANGCSDTDDVTVTVNPLPPADAGPDVDICYGDCATLTASGGVAYIWSTGNTAATINVCPLVTTVYVVTVTDANGCSDTDDVIVTVNPLPVANAGLDVEICYGDCTNLTASGAGAGGAYSWNNGSTTASINVCPTITTTYTVTVTDINGCTDDDEVIVTVNLLPVADAGPDVAICDGDCTTLTATGGVSYLWSNNIANQTMDVCPTVTTTYTVTVTDANGCSNTDDVTVTVNPLPPANAGLDVDICYGDCTNLTATGGVTYIWNTGDMTATINVCPLVTTTYTVTVTDANGCVNTDNVTVNVHPLPVADAGQDVDICNGDCTNLTASGAGAGGTYMWNTNSSDKTINVCPSVTTTYTVTVTDIYGCTDSDVVVVSVNPIPPANAGPDVAICTGDCTTLMASGGVTYMWSNNFAGPTIDVCPMVTTTYTVTVTDANGCSNTDDVTVTVNPLPPANAGADVEICSGNCATLTASGGTTYLWNTGDNTATINVCPMTTTTYTVTVTDANGCSNTDEVTVTVNPLPIANAGPDVSLCDGDCTTLTASGAGIGGSYQWNTGGMGAAIYVCPTATTTYSVTVTDANGCTGSDEVIVIVFSLPIADAGPDVTICDGDCTTLTASGGIDYLWSNNVITPSIDVCPTITTTYTVTVTDVNGCSSSDDVVVTVSALPVVTFDSIADVCADAPSFALTGGNPTGGVYSGTGVSGGSFDPSVAGVGTHTLTYTYTDLNGCTNFATQTVTVNPLPMVYFTPIADVCIDDAQFMLTQGVPSVPAGIYSGPGVVGGTDFSPILAGVGTHTLTYTYTDLNGCVNSATQTIDVNALPVQFTVTGGGYYCAGGAGVEVGLQGTEVGVDYDLILNGVTYIATINGTGAAISYGNQTAAGTYTVYAYNVATGCDDIMTGSVDVGIYPLPVATASSNSPVCENEPIMLYSSGGGCSIPSYCPSTSSSYIQEYISNVSLNNASQASVGSFYTDYTSNVFTKLNINGTYTLSVTNYVDGTFPEHVTAFIDWNRNGIFEAADSIYMGTFNGTHTFTKNITVPTSAVLGKTMMRIINQWGSKPSACGAYGYGETEDYKIEITDGTGLSCAYSWSGPNSFSSSQQNPIVTDSATMFMNGVYTVTVTDVNLCVSTASVNVIVNALPLVSISGLDTAYCLNDLPAPLTGTPAGGIFTGTGISGNFFYPAIAGVGTHTVTYTYDNGNCVNKVTKQVIVRNIPQMTLTDDLTICQGDTVQLTAGGGTSYLWSTGEITPDIMVYPNNTTVYHVTVTNIFGCSVSDSVVVNVNPVPIVNAGNDDAICLGSSTMLTPVVSGGGGVYSYQWSPAAGLDDPSIKNPIASPVDSTYYILTVVDLIYGCVAEDTVLIEVYPVPAADAGPNDTTCYGQTVTLTASPPGMSYLWSTTQTTQSINVVAADTTTYYVTVTNSYGCSAYDSVSVIANPVPFGDAGDNETICFGDLVELEATGGGNYEWLTSPPQFTQSILVQPNDTTEYKCVISNIYGCTDTASVWVFVNPLPVVNITADPGATVCKNQKVTLDAGFGFDTYLWTNGDTTQTITIDSTGVGIGTIIYNVIVTKNGCDASQMITITFEDCIGIDDPDLDEFAIDIYPNPTTGRFNIAINGYENDLNLTIFNNIGQLIHNEKLELNRSKAYIREFDLTKYQPGIYFLRFTDGKMIRTKKIIIQ